MANNLRFNASELPPDAENQNETEKKQSGIWGIISKGIRQGIDETHNSANNIFNLEENEKLSFKDAARKLEDTLDLPKIFVETVRSHRHWGLIDAHIEAGIVQNEDEYVELLSNAETNSKSLDKVFQESKNNPDKYLPIFDTNYLGPVEMFKTIIENNRIPFSRENDAYEKLGQIRRINPFMIPALEDLHEVSESEQRAALIATYIISPRLKPSKKPRLLFTPNEIETSNTNQSAVHDLQKMAYGEINLIDPTADFLRFRLQIDRGIFETCARIGLKNPDREEYFMILKKLFLQRHIYKFTPDLEKLTRYSNFFFENGTALTMHFDPHRHRLFLQSILPNDQSVIFGSRIVL